ncbi:MAG: biotin transporter BioY [Candidatus Nanopelagicales bacterium]
MAIATPAPRVLADVVAHTRVANLALILGGAAFVGVTAQIVIPLPFTPVPLTLQTFAVLLVGAALGTWRGVASMVVYAAAGSAGVPWFSAGSSGAGGASYGYILGFIVAAGVVGRLAERGATLTPLRTAGLMVVGNLVIYSIGVTYLKFAIDVPWSTALALGVVPFLLGDALKIALAAGLLPGTWRLLSRAGVRN